MPLRTRLFIIIGLVVGVLVLVFGGIWWKNNRTAPTTEPVATTTTSGSDMTNRTTITPTEIPSGVVVKPATTLEAEQNGVRQLAKVFVERYNTFSSDNNYDNIRDVEELVTPTLWSKISGRLTSPQPEGEFTAVTSEIMNTTLSDWSANRATVTLNGRKLTESNGQTTETMQTVTVVMVKLGTNWLADSFTNE